MFNWQLPDWPHFTYRLAHEDHLLFDFAKRAGRVSGLLETMPTHSQNDTVIEMMVFEAIKTSAIEGEFLSREDVMSSIKRNLGLNPRLKQVHDLRAQGAAELMINVRQTFDEPLSEEMLFSWHKMIMKGSKGINTGQWRSHAEPMQVVSGPIGRETVHFEAPPSTQVPAEMKRFIQWFNDTGPGGSDEINKPPIRSAIAHVYFETIHPFEDGNGRIGRAISEKALSQGIGQPALISLSRTIEENRNAYYEGLKSAQKTNDLTEWILYFVNVILDAQKIAQEYIEFTLRKTKYFDHYRPLLNDRQSRAVLRMLEEGPKGFQGGMTAKKYMTINKTSKATATRDLHDLAVKGALKAYGGGRSTRYEIHFKD